jgi:hypothetical protein
MAPAKAVVIVVVLADLIQRTESLVRVGATVEKPIADIAICVGEAGVVDGEGGVLRTLRHRLSLPTSVRLGSACQECGGEQELRRNNLLELHYGWILELAKRQTHLSSETF